MHKHGLHIIRSIQKKWMLVSLFSNTVFAGSFTVLFSFLARDVFRWPFFTVIVFFVIILALLLYINNMWRVTEKETARYLNKQYPSLEESCELLLEDAASLNLLENLQANKTEAALSQIGRLSFFGNIKFPLLSLLASIILYILLSFIAHGFPGVKRGAAVAVTENKSNLPAGVSNIYVTIIPPTYTHKPVREQNNMNLTVEEGATVHWKLAFTKPATSVNFIYNDSISVALQPANKDGTMWVSEKTISDPGFYQLKIDSVVSALYKIEVTKDQPPVILVTSPKPNTVIEYGEPQRVNLQANVSDDYGVKDVTINATIAKGSGEGVKFTSQQLSFGASFAAQNLQYNLQKTIVLTAMAMEPGDELYFYISAMDNHAQEKRSDIYIVSITDTAQLMSMDGLLNGVNVKPDYFRSQRQIILDAEQLIREKDTVTAENFKNRSNNLGIDQKLLRLRYGKFLGEEASSNEDVTGNTLGNPAEFGNAALILDAFTDHHDNAEDASFLDTETKKQLKAVLTEMWNSELQLRTYKPKDALPFAYKALRLLKDLQQKSRAYVAKTSSKTAPIKLEKRLTGKLEKIVEPVTHANIAAPNDPAEELRNALAVLELLKRQISINDKAIQVLRLATAQVSNQAAKNPSLYLPALEGMKRIINASQDKRNVTYADIVTAQKALQDLAGIPYSLPSTKQSPPSLSLSEQYFRNLHKNEKQ
jgi:hypothetical protein